MSDSVLDHSQKLEGYLRDLAKARANATEVKHTKILSLVEALSKVATGSRTNAPETQVAGDREADALFYRSIASPERSRPRTREQDGKSRRTTRAGKENKDPVRVWGRADGARSAYRQRNTVTKKDAEG